MSEARIAVIMSYKNSGAAGEQTLCFFLALRGTAAVKNKKFMSHLLLFVSKKVHFICLFGQNNVIEQLQ